MKGSSLVFLACLPRSKHVEIPVKILEKISLLIDEIIKSTEGRGGRGKKIEFLGARSEEGRKNRNSRQEQKQRAAPED